MSYVVALKVVRWDGLLDVDGMGKGGDVEVKV